MFSNFSRLRLVSAWCALILVIAAVSVVAGAASRSAMPDCVGGRRCTLNGHAPHVGWRPPPATVAELLHAVNRPAKD